MQTIVQFAVGAFVFTPLLLAALWLLSRLGAALQFDER
jgi:hypothetical protein